MDEPEPRALVAHVEGLLEELEGLSDPVGRDKANAVVQGLLELYGAGLARMVEAIASCDDGAIAQAFIADELVSHLLLLHGLHPLGVEERVLEALGEVRPYLESHGGNVALVGVDESTVHLRMQGSCSGCPSSTMTLKLAIENAIRKAAPEIEDVIAEEQDGAPLGGSSLLQIELSPGLGASTGSAEADASLHPVSGRGAIDGDWVMAGGLPELAGGGVVIKTLSGQPILFLKVDGRAYGYRPGCPACQQSLGEATLREAELTCPGCGARFDALRAGRCLDSPQLHLEPVPLLEGEDGLVRIALPVAA